MCSTGRFKGAIPPQRHEEHEQPGHLVQNCTANQEEGSVPGRQRVLGTHEQHTHTLATNLGLKMASKPQTRASPNALASASCCTARPSGHAHHECCTREAAGQPRTKPTAHTDSAAARRQPTPTTQGARLSTRHPYSWLVSACPTLTGCL